MEQNKCFGCWGPISGKPVSPNVIGVYTKRQLRERGISWRDPDWWRKVKFCSVGCREEWESTQWAINQLQATADRAAAV